MGAPEPAKSSETADMSRWLDEFRAGLYRAWQRRYERTAEQLHWWQRSPSERAAIIRNLTLYWLLALVLFAAIWLLKWLFAR
jgi:Flp pilus assembly protein TadB